jgi:hypothetical protein
MSEPMNQISTPFKSEFMRRMNEEWLPAYCNDPKRQYPIEGFRMGKDGLTDKDAEDFLRALDHGVATLGDRQRLKMTHGYASETLFWEGSKTVNPRPISLWLESVITVAVGARLHLDYGWPIESLGMQSKDSAFDVMVFKAPDFVNEHVAVEVKKTSREVDNLIENLTKCCAGDHDVSCHSKGTRLNAHRKWIALHARRPSLFWAVGPSPNSRLFEVLVAPDGSIRLQATPSTRLHFDEDKKGSELTIDTPPEQRQQMRLSA